MPSLGSPLLTGDVGLSAENEALQQEAIGAYLRHVTMSNEHQLRVFRWQLLSSKIIFAVVVLLVASGIYFAAVQFHHGLREGLPRARLPDRVRRDIVGWSAGPGV